MVSRYLRRWVAAATLVAFVAAGCSSSDPIAQAPTAPDEVVVDQGATSEADEASDVAPVEEADVEQAPVAPAEEEDNEAAPAEEVDPSDTETEVEPSQATTAEPAEPEEAPEPREPAGEAVSIPVPDIGASAWAVAIAGASDQFDPRLEETEQEILSAGFDTTITNFDVGAALALGMAPSTSFTVSVYAADEQNATGLAEALAGMGLPGEVTEIVVDCG